MNHLQYYKGLLEVAQPIRILSSKQILIFEFVAHYYGIYKYHYLNPLCFEAYFRKFSPPQPSPHFSAFVHFDYNLYKNEDKINIVRLHYQSIEICNYMEG